ncbi:hypothetical protein KY284_013154 [Solanum tuberosum]|nr:hypothetical protein KY284_013154 [Solanum tuberosum]
MVVGWNWISRLLALLFSRPRRKRERGDAAWSSLFPPVEPAAPLAWLLSRWLCHFAGYLLLVVLRREERGRGDYLRWLLLKKRGEGRRRLAGRLLLLVAGVSPLVGSFTSRRWSSSIAGQTKKKKVGEGKDRKEKWLGEREGH